MSIEIIGKKQGLIPNGGNDNVYTPKLLAEAIVDHFNPRGLLLDPCSGKGAFSSAMRPYGKVHIMEVNINRNFLTQELFSDHYDWIITNPPWSKITAFLKRSLPVCDNLVFLCLINAFWQNARTRLMKENGFAFKEILLVREPPKPWPKCGMSLGVINIQKGYKGDIKQGELLWN